MIRATLACTLLLLTALLLAGCDSDNDNNNNKDKNPPPAATAAARQATGDADLLQGPLARSTEGDFVLENDLIRVIVQQPGRNWFGIGTYGGNIIDAARKLDDGSYLPDQFEEFVSGVNIENTPNYTEVWVDNDGADGEPARVCARGPDDLFDYINASTAVRQLGLKFPASADDRDLPFEIETCYSLAADESWVTIDTRVINTSADTVDIWWLEYLNGSGEVEVFQPRVGLGEVLFTTACPAKSRVACDSGECDQCNYIAFTGYDDAAGVSYGLIHDVPDTTSLSVFGANVLIFGETIFNISNSSPNFKVPADGELSLRRYFAVGDGTASSIADIRNRLFGFVTGELAGTVTSDGKPVAGANVAIYKSELEGDPPTLFMAGHSRTDAEGNYRLTLPPGDYEVQANATGHLYAAGSPYTVTIGAEQNTRRDFDLPPPGYLQVSVTATVPGGNPEPVPAKVQVLGFDPSPDPGNNVLGERAGVFEDNVDPLPWGVTLVDFIDRNGHSGKLTLEPGQYQVVVSRGPRYSAFRQDITIAPGQTTEVQAELALVLSTPGHVYGDFHVHSINSPDSGVVRQERVATYLAENVDFFTPSEHDMRVDFGPTIESMGVTDLIGTASSAEITSFDYGHFNSWPVTVDDSLIGGGSVDWGREAPPGMDFPEYASYALSPAEIFEQSLADPKGNIVQINHIASHFGNGGFTGGLAIDTGITPPQSKVDLTQRRLDPALGNAFDDGFDALEVWIGTDGRSGILNDFLGQNLGDWFNLVNQGIVRTGVADSDTHKRRITYLATRNQIPSATTDPARLSQQAATLAATVAAGKVVGTNAPFVTIEATDGEATADLSLAGSRTLAIDSGREVTVTVRIASAAWAAVDTVDFYVNNQPELTSAAGSPARYGVCADYSVRAGDPGWQSRTVVVDVRNPGASRTETEVTLTLPAVTADTWLVAIAHGSDGLSPPLFPVVPEDLDRVSNTSLADLTDGNIGEGGVMAYAFTNPLFIDVGGDGWTPPGVANAACSP